MNDQPNPVRMILTSHSIDNVFDYCARKFEFLNVYDKRPPRESGYAASVGTALHEGVQQWLIARAQGLTEWNAQAKGYMSMLKTFPWEEEEQQKTSTRSASNCIMMLGEIMASPEWVNWELMEVKDHGWAVEIPFLIRHASVGLFTLKNTGETCMLATQGKIDLVMRNKINGSIKTIDIKTTINSEDTARAEYTYSGQQIGYSHVIHAMLGVAPQDFSVFYVICRFSTSEPQQIQWLEMFKGEDMIDDYWMAKLDRLSRMRAYAEAGWFPRTNGGCHAWGRECSCFDICRSRDVSLIQRWFEAIEAVPAQGYDYWVTMEI